MKYNLDVEFEAFTLKGDIIETSQKPHLLVLHGAGKSQRHVFRSIRHELYRRGIGSAAFDCIGHGETGGHLEGSSLKSRTEQASQFIHASGLFNTFAI